MLASWHMERSWGQHQWRWKISTNPAIIRMAGQLFGQRTFGFVWSQCWRKTRPDNQGLETRWILPFWLADLKQWSCERMPGESWHRAGRSWQSGIRGDASNVPEISASHACPGHIPEIQSAHHRSNTKLQNQSSVCVCESHQQPQISSNWSGS